MRTLIKSRKIKKAIAKVAREISRDYAGQEVTFVCVLSGAFMFFAELLQRIKDVDANVVFVKVASYGVGKSAGKLEFGYETREVGARENVIIVDDIYDSGQTMHFLLEKYSHANSVKSCVLLEKKVPHTYPLELDYRALECEDEFIVGFGLDYAEKFRNLPDIKVV
ncbi:phosphoribosyltransferase [Treponema sp. R6D11]